MSFNCIEAYTAPGSNYPPYINISFVDENTVRVTVRSKNKGESDSLAPSIIQGDIAYIDIPRDIAIDLFIDAADKVRYE